MLFPHSHLLSDSLSLYVFVVLPSYRQSNTIHRIQSSFLSHYFHDTSSSTSSLPTGLSSNIPLDRAVSMRPTTNFAISANKGLEPSSQIDQSNMTAPKQTQSNHTAPVFNEVYELPGAMFDSTDILVSANSSGQCLCLCLSLPSVCLLID